MGKWKYKDRYGIPGAEVNNLVKRFYSLNCKEGFETVDNFLLWCSRNGYKKGLMLRRRDPDQPHGPDNSYYLDNYEQRREKQERIQHYRSTQSAFCINCSKETCPDGGCREWADYWTANWNKNIYIPPVKPAPVKDPNTVKVWRYEHPDLVREGIVWSGT